DFYLRPLDHFHKGVKTLIVDDRRDAAQDDDLALAAQGLDDVLGRNPAQRGIVAGNVDVLDTLFGQPPVDDGDKDALLLDKLDGTGERVGLKRQDDQRVDLVDRDEVLQVVDLLRGTAGGDDDDL